MKVTLENLAQATEQQIFDQVATHLLTQKKQSATVTGGCKYRHNGLMCAAGCLIADDEYRESLENSSWLKLSNAGQVPEAHKGFIHSLQRIHDSKFSSNWFHCLEQLAIAHKLSFDTAKYKSLQEGV